MEVMPYAYGVIAFIGVVAIVFVCLVALSRVLGWSIVVTNRHVVRVFNPDRKDTQWGRCKLARDRWLPGSDPSRVFTHIHDQEIEFLNVST
jgi:hypothetical protein